jgi:hypothetical protein
LTKYCQEEITNGAITITDLSLTHRVQFITANFAVLNLIADHPSLFKAFAQLVVAEGSVLVSVLNPFFVGDARYAWWRKNLPALLCTGTYVVEGEFGPTYRFLPSAVFRAAEPDFRIVACIPQGLKLAASRYIFMLFKRQ